MPDGDAYRSTHLTQGPWNPEHQHGGPVTGAARARRRGGADARADAVRPADRRHHAHGPGGPARRTGARVVRAGRSVQLVEAALVHDGLEVAPRLGLASADRRRRSHAHAPTAARQVTAVAADPGRGVGPHEGRAPRPRLPPRARHAPGHRRTRPGAPTCTWFRLRVPGRRRGGHPPFVRLAALADFTSGTANYLPIDKWSSINADISIHVLREPIGEWIAVGTVAPRGRRRHRALPGHAVRHHGDGRDSGSTAQVVDRVGAPFTSGQGRTRDGRSVVNDEGVLDPEVAAWMEANPLFVTPLEDRFRRDPRAGPDFAPPTPTDDLPDVYDDTVAGVPVRVYRQADRADRAGRLLPRRRVLHRQHRPDGQRRVGTRPPRQARPPSRSSIGSLRSTRSRPGSTTATRSPDGPSPAAKASASSATA